MTRGVLLLLLVGCGESFTADRQTLSAPEPAGSGGEEQTGGVPATGGSGGFVGGAGGASGRAPGGMGGSGVGGTGSMSGSGGSPSGAAGVSGESGAGGAPWMPSRCVEPVDLTVTATRAWEVELYFPPTAAVYVHEIEARWWFSREGECFIDPYWNGSNDGVTLELEPAVHTTPEGSQTDVMTIAHEPLGAGEMARARQLLYFGGCSVEDDVSNDYSASAVEHVAVYVRGELVAGCEP